MYYDLFSDYNEQEHDFKFAHSEDKLPKINAERSGRIVNSDSEEHQLLSETCWFSSQELFTRLRQTSDARKVAANIFRELATDGMIRKDGLQELKKNHIMENVRDFKERIFDDKSITISKVEAHIMGDIRKDRQRIIEMFQRLNSNGTKLSRCHDKNALSTQRCPKQKHGKYDKH